MRLPFVGTIPKVAWVRVWVQATVDTGVWLNIPEGEHRVPGTHEVFFPEGKLIGVTTLAEDVVELQGTTTLRVTRY